SRRSPGRPGASAPPGHSGSSRDGGLRELVLRVVLDVGHVNGRARKDGAARESAWTGWPGIHAPQGIQELGTDSDVSEAVEELAIEHHNAPVQGAAEP